ncbi:MAG TPA: Na/Pi cotransporter family protein [Bacillota bacterium]|jgi:phosphate:Na+ symporter|nr:Na/Pi cotransporter family protein [Bacillota bacterium]HQC48170.1 Na/Pi cotransporter family protein [Bacillota bacterium]
MDIFSFATLLGGLALFLFGMKEMGDGLMLLSGSKLKSMLGRVTSNPVNAVLVGTGITSIIQSSSATTVMVVGLVNAGLLSLSQSVGIIMGANIGTTTTAWILTLGTLGAGSTYLDLLKPSFFAPLIAFFAVGVLMFVKDEKKRNISKIAIGFAVLMFGMQAMSNSVVSLADSPEFCELFIRFKNPFLGLIVGAILTAVIQSSSASIGILQALSATGVVTYGSAIPIILGQNIGTCVTAMLSSINTSKNARRSALIHLFFNVIGSVVFIAVFYSINLFRPFAFLDKSLGAVNIAIFNTLYNTSNTLLLLPFRHKLVKFVTWILPDGKRGEEVPETENVFGALEARFLESPGLAVAQSRQVASQMAELVKHHYEISIDLLYSFDAQRYQESRDLEVLIDDYEDHLGTYMVQISARQLTDKDSRTLTQMMQSIGDFERISDHAYSIALSAKEMYDKKIIFSDAALNELAVKERALQDLLDMTVQAFRDDDLELAARVEPLEEVIDGLNDELRARHVKRLQDGFCTLELGFIFNDILTGMERIADHCSNLAVCMIELSHESLDHHIFLRTLETSEDFLQMVAHYRREYLLPEVQVSEYAGQISLEESLANR